MADGRLVLSIRMKYYGKVTSAKYTSDVTITIDPTKEPPRVVDVAYKDDNTVPASLSKAQFKRYESSPAKTDYLEFEGRPHLHMAAADWQEVAAAIDSWLDGVLDAPITETEETPA